MTLTLEIPDEEYAPLLRRAQQLGTTPERIVLDSISATNAGDQPSSDPVLRMLGAFRSEIPDISARHDAFIGDAYRSEGANNSGA